MSGDAEFVIISDDGDTEPDVIVTNRHVRRAVQAVLDGTPDDDAIADLEDVTARFLAAFTVILVKLGITPDFIRTTLANVDDHEFGTHIKDAFQAAVTREESAS